MPEIEQVIEWVGQWGNDPFVCGCVTLSGAALSTLGVLARVLRRRRNRAVAAVAEVEPLPPDRASIIVDAPAGARVHIAMNVPETGSLPRSVSHFDGNWMSHPQQGETD